MSDYTAAEIETMAYILLGEAESGDVEGMNSVAHVVRNRAKSGLYSSDPYTVISDPTEFNAAADLSGAKARNKPGSGLYNVAVHLVKSVILADEDTPDPTGDALFYHALTYTPKGSDAAWWNKVKTEYGTLNDGSHLFYARAPQDASFNEAALAALGLAEAGDGVAAPIPLNRPAVFNETKMAKAHSEWVTQLQPEVADVRTLPLSPKLLDALTAVGSEANVHFEVTSGGQDDTTGRVGSHRHDFGNSADTKAYTLNDDGTKHYLDMSNADDRKVWERVVQLAVAGGITGIGAGPDYMGNFTMHLGYGSPLTWGAGGHVANAPQWLKDAYALGTKTPPLNIPDVLTKLATGDAVKNASAFGPGARVSALVDDHRNPPAPNPVANLFSRTGMPVDEALSVTPVLEWNMDDPTKSVLINNRPKQDVVFDPERGSFVLTEIRASEVGIGGGAKLIGPRQQVDFTALDIAMAAAHIASPTPTDALYEGIYPISGAQNYVRPEVIAPAQRGSDLITHEVTTVKTDAYGIPIPPGSKVASRVGIPSELPAAPAKPYQPLVASRPDAPVGKLPGLILKGNAAGGSGSSSAGTLTPGPNTLDPKIKYEPKTPAQRIDDAVNTHRSYDVVDFITDALASRVTQPIGAPIVNTVRPEGKPDTKTVKIVQKAVVAKVTEAAHTTVVNTVRPEVVAPASHPVAQKVGGTGVSGNPANYNPPPAVKISTPVAKPATKVITVAETKTVVSYVRPAVIASNIKQASSPTPAVKVNAVRPEGPAAGLPASNKLAGGAAAAGKAAIPPVPVAPVIPPKPKLVPVKKIVTTYRKITVPVGPAQRRPAKVYDPSTNTVVTQKIAPSQQLVRKNGFVFVQNADMSLTPTAAAAAAIKRQALTGGDGMDRSAAGSSFTGPYGKDTSNVRWGPTKSFDKMDRGELERWYGSHDESGYERKTPLEEAKLKALVDGIIAKRAA